MPPLLREDRSHENTGDDQRSRFQRDRDRVLYSWSFRRLAGVTQVVHAAEGHVFHNRLTHSIKVAQVARRIAEHVIRSTINLPTHAANLIDPDVVETAALIHDLGHPPFGHAAETELDGQLKRKNVNDGYEGNAQSFRIVTKVDLHNPEYPGLDLTRATLNACLKYPWPRGQTGEAQKKWGYYQSEVEDFRFARELGPSGSQQSPEAAIMDWADDITYSVHDVEDFYRAGLIPLHLLLAGPNDPANPLTISIERERFLTAVYDKWEREKDISLNHLDRDAAKEFLEYLGALFSGLDTPFVGSGYQELILHGLSSFLIKRYIVGDGDATSETQAVTLVVDPNSAQIKVDSKFQAEVKLLKALMWHYVYGNHALVAQQFGQRRIIADLFNWIFDAVQPASSTRHILPVRFQEYCETIDANQGIGPPDLERPRIAADIIASMTEQQALMLYQRLSGINPGSIHDPIVL